MQVQWGRSRFELLEGDIVDQTTDAIVNAAHPDLLGGQGVDGAIHYAGGPTIVEQCRRLGGCPVGDAVITTGGRLPARYVIHTVGPVHDPYADESPLLAAAYDSSLRLAARYRLTSVAFPSISTGAFCYPMKLAAPVALRAIRRFLLDEAHALDLVRLVLYPRERTRGYAVYRAALEELLDADSTRRPQPR